MKMEIGAVRHTRPVTKDGCITYVEVNGALSCDPNEGSVEIQRMDGSRTEFRFNPLILKQIGAEWELKKKRAKELHELQMQEAQARASEASARAEEAKLHHQIEMVRLQKQLLLEEKELREMKHQQQGKKSLTHNHNKIMGKKTR